MRRDRSLLIAAALLSILTLGLAASVLESTPLAASYDIPAENDGGSSPSIVGVFLLLFAAFFELIGIEIELSTPAGAPGSGIEILVVALTILRSVALPLLVVGVCAAIVLLVGRRLPKSDAETIAALLNTWFRSPEKPARSNSTGETWPPAEPENDVSRAWVSMTEHLEVDHPNSRTPTEWADAAIDAGFDDTAVAKLTGLFEEIRYGDTIETAVRRRRAKRELERLEDETE